MPSMRVVSSQPQSEKIIFSRVLPKGLLGRSLLIIVAPLILLQVVSAIVFYDRHWANVSRHRANAIVGDVSLVIGLLHDQGTGVSRDWVMNNAYGYLGLSTEFVPGVRLDDANFVPAGFIERRLALSMTQLGRPFSIAIDEVSGRISVSVQLIDGVLHVSFDEERLVSSTNRIFIFWMIGTSLVLMGLAAIFMRNQVRPIRRLAIAADDFGKGRVSTKWRPSGASEVRRAAIAFNAMRERIQLQLQQQTEMLAGVSHDLRTPLTRMRLLLAMLERKPEIKYLEADIIAMESMIDGYLNFVRGDAGETRRQCEVREMLAGIVETTHNKGRDIELVMDQPARLLLAQNAFKRCIEALVDNALRHGDRVRVQARRVDNVLEITIDDDGKGIPPEDREDVFRPFHRLDSACGEQTGGAGLGLTIARDIARGHGGNTVLGDSPLGGLRVTVQIPF